MQSQVELLRKHWSLDQVGRLLAKLIKREGAHWKPRKYAVHSPNNSEISGVQRDYTVRWFSAINKGFGLPTETLFLATALFDEFLRIVRAKPRYIQVVAMSCYFLAAKMTVDDDAIPPLAGLIRISGCECSVSEVRRMERVILEKLSWDLRRATALDFLHAYHALLENNCESVLGPEGPGKISQLGVLWETKLQIFLAQNELLAAEKPSTVALALVSLEMEQLTPHWLLITVALQSLAQVEKVEDVIRCREELSRNLHLSQKRQASKRKMDSAMDEDEQDCIYDSIKKLYAEENYTQQNANSKTLVQVV